MRLSKITATASAVLTLAILLAGCGNNNELPSNDISSATGVSQSDVAATSEVPSVSSEPQSAAVTSTTETQVTETISTTAEQTAQLKTIYKSEGTRKIWAGVVGKIYVVFKSSDAADSGIYELWVDAGDGYTSWSDGYWSMNSSKTELKLTPKNQNENGSIGVAVGETKTYKADDGAFKVEFSFEQGGKSAIKFNPAKDAV